jgi:hypothetical protein
VRVVFYAGEIDLVVNALTRRLTRMLSVSEIFDLAEMSASRLIMIFNAKSCDTTSFFAF